MKRSGAQRSCRASTTLLVLGFMLAQSSFSLAQPVDAQTRNAARSLAESAAVAYESGDYERALDLFRRAYAIVPAPTISIYEARCLAKLGLLIEATERYEDTTRTPAPPDAPPAFLKAQEEAERELVEVRDRTPRIRIKIDGPSANSTTLSVVLDGKAVRRELVDAPITVNPGLHRIGAAVPGIAHGRASVLAQERQFQLVSVPLVPYADEEESRPAPRDRTAGGGARKTWGFVLLGVGAAGVAVGATGAIVANGKRADLDRECDGDRCPSSAQDDLDAFRSARTTSFIGYGVGALGLAGGAVLLLLPEGDSGRVGVVPRIGIGSIGAAGRF